MGNQRRRTGAATPWNTGRGGHDSVRPKQQQTSGNQPRASTPTSSVNIEYCAGNPMLACNRSVNDRDDALFCENCNRWFHIQCQNISKSKYEAIGELSNEVSWFCIVCKVAVPKVLDAVSSISRRVDTLEEEVDNIKARVSSLEDKDIGLGLTDIDQLRDTITKECKEVIRQENDRARRSNNLIVFGIAESPLSTSEDERIRADKDKVQSILTDELGLSNILPEKVIRLHPKAVNPARTSPAPVKLVMKCHADRATILQKARALANPKSPENRVYISPDLCKEDREANNKLREELKTKREASRANNENCRWSIHRRKVVKFPGTISGQENALAAPNL